MRTILVAVATSGLAVLAGPATGHAQQAGAQVGAGAGGTGANVGAGAGAGGAGANVGVGAGDAGANVGAGAGTSAPSTEAPPPSSLTAPDQSMQQPAPVGEEQNATVNVTVETPPPPPPPKPIKHPASWGTLTAGGGPAAMQSGGTQTELGGTWVVNLTLSPPMSKVASLPIAFDLAYIGSLNGFSADPSIIQTNAALAGNAFEGNLRLQSPLALAHVVRPYVLAGAGINRFDIVNNSLPTAFRNNHDNTFVLPVGVGIQWEPGDHFVIDTQFRYRIMYGEDIFKNSPLGDQSTSMWTAQLRLGYRF
jgi:opacity protein-like surface antigen